MRNQYLSILDLPSDASLEDIKKAYREKAKKYHPDVSKNPEAKRQFILATEAYKFLTEVGPQQTDAGYNYNYNSDRDAYAEQRRRARQYARERAREEAIHKKHTLETFFKYFNIVTWTVLIFNAVLVLDYYLPSEVISREILYAKQSFYQPRSGPSIHRHDIVMIDNLELKLEPGAAEGLSGSKAKLFITPIFNNLKSVDIKIGDEIENKIPSNRLYRILRFFIILAFFFSAVYLWLKNYNYNKTTFAVIIAILLIIELFLVARYSFMV